MQEGWYFREGEGEVPMVFKVVGRCFSVIFMNIFSIFIIFFH